MVNKMQLEQFLGERKKQKDILLMTHIVLGYPSLQDSFTIVEKMVNAGVDLIELQIPFSEPVAEQGCVCLASRTSSCSL